IDVEVAELTKAVEAEQQSIDARLATEDEKRSGLAGAMPAELLAEYERLREHLGGIGAARLERGMCSGCRLSLPAQEVDRIHKAPPGELFHCDQCGRILVPA